MLVFYKFIYKLHVQLYWYTSSYYDINYVELYDFNSVGTILYSVMNYLNSGGLFVLESVVDYFYSVWVYLCHMDK